MPDIPTLPPRLLTESEFNRFRGCFEVVSDGCWQWKLALDRDGYGHFFLRRRGRIAHRVAYAAWVRPIPQGHVVNHLCRNRSCVNPAHLETIRASEHPLLDDSLPAINARKTHCPRGHAYDRFWRAKNGRRQRGCSICESEKAKRLRAKWRHEEPKDLLTA